MKEKEKMKKTASEKVMKATMEEKMKATAGIFPTRLHISCNRHCYNFLHFFLQKPLVTVL